ncbi:hypothetical protein [Actinacidiphila sp. ITFR-21]|uniref:hypothetical protein n=1 Tax=Actinacidiphila sp. ITFR-21 TaxID=3075199 RepID=UPI00288A007F|nr:hypothetical protein [Streptomyces sp. ITFR-21]WNI19158.1 hypothetical protein RLT57_28885 [Streptomyces sp. ITFR-21]
MTTYDELTPDALRDRILTAIRDADSHSCMYQEGIDAGELADAVMEVLDGEASGTCDASTIMNLGFFGRPSTFGPCILRHEHDGPAHKDANGAEWRPTEGGVIEAPESMTEEQIDAFRAAWVQHYADHVTSGSICIHSPSQVAESLDQQQKGRP